jgi:hexosaminidase
MVTKYNKTMVGWCEIGNGPIDPGTIVQDWYRNFETCGGTGAGVGKGAVVIFSPAEHAYLDMKYDESTPWGHDWAGHVSVQKAYEWSPTRPEVPADKVLGVEAAVWTEFIDDRQAVDRMVFPRLSGHAEIGWSPQTGRSWNEYRVRLARHGLRLEQLGVDFYRSPQVDWE